MTFKHLLLKWTANDCKYDPSKAAATVSTSTPVTSFAAYDIPPKMAALASRKLLVVTISIPDNFYNLV